MSIATHQGLLYRHLQLIFPNERLEYNVQKRESNNELKHPTTGAHMELDVCLPNCNLAFEFQDTHHYITTWYNHNTTRSIQERDIVKELKARENGMTLIDIPCWWDGSIAQLVAVIDFKRPDLNLPLSSNFILPISLNPPTGYFLSNELPGVGELMLASFPPENFFSSFSPTSWWMGEKYDGVRCCWDPFSGLLYTRNRCVLEIDTKFLYCFPSSAFIDFEFWFGRGQFGNIYGLIHNSTNFSYAHLRAIAFDIPSTDFHTSKIEKRYKRILDSVSFDNPIIINAMRKMSKNREAMKREIKEITEEGGEGVILQRIASLYLPGRNSLLLKIKANQGDAEAIVIAFGDHKSVILQLPNGTTFTVPEEDVQITNLQIGFIVSFFYERFSRRNVIFRHRPDLMWEDVVQSSAAIGKDQLTSFKEQEFSKKPLGHWTMKAMREFLENFARNKKLDPLRPHTWYNARNEINNTKEGRIIIQKLNGYSSALSQLFPEIQFNISEFQTMNWSATENRRLYLETFAKENKFDPQVPENWYKLSRKQIQALRKKKQFLAYHDRNLAKAVIDLFPNIGIDPAKLTNFKTHKIQWNDPIKRRNFFEDVAKENNFDPLSASDWYRNYSKIRAKNGRSILTHHSDDVFQALYELFPDVAWHRNLSKETSIQRDTAPWHDFSNRRKFFEDFAKEHNFDAFDPDNWLYQHHKIKLTKMYSAVIRHYGNSFFKALIYLFPEVDWSKSYRFERVILGAGVWKDGTNRREFFEKYAKENNFDYLDPQSWLTHKYPIMWEKNVSDVVFYHNNEVSQALIDLFPDVDWGESLHSRPQWHNKDNRRQFFIDFAKENNFDPLVLSNWNKQSVKLFTTKNGKSVLKFHGYKMSRALKDLFPELQAK